MYLNTGMIAYVISMHLHLLARFILYNIDYTSLPLLSYKSICPSLFHFENCILSKPTSDIPTADTIPLNWLFEPYLPSPKTILYADLMFR